MTAPTLVSCVDASLTLQAHRDLLGKRRGREPPAGLRRGRDPGAHLEAGRALALADRQLVLDSEGLRPDLGDRGADPDHVAVVHRRAEPGTRLHDGHTDDAVPGEDLRPRQPERLEQRLGCQVEPLEEAWIEDDPGGIRLGPAHLDLDRVTDHSAPGVQTWPPCSPRVAHRSPRRLAVSAVCPLWPLTASSRPDP